MKKPAKIVFNRQTITEALAKGAVPQDSTPYTDSFSAEGWSGDAVCVSVEVCQALEKAANNLAAAANHTVMTGEGLTELDRALDEYKAVIKSRSNQ